ncbi:MAG TPA: Gfo/Idh/MocA family oxidoreductase [Bacteroidales bacterium]|nr:Gfo/Idh/MocA family oxidoreductase [Bacteroidales bacterium]HOK75836.1 Gfo/Idh/MocA family oxidoreductase [Bacteroidales bacterium]HOM41364.1 Gfo/Idh/MocA family oxidoreductase [Bacteroidales bacterium]HPP93125.1 Gfo/Idh/MocA family oxidoreductase [Bacteroidales bacterium]HRR17107.1 Gfo/Idh/MocA family oxidoreductase [Bacteroidales bacterium]
MINWGIIGCGNVTEVKSGPAFNKVPGSRLVAVMRRNRALAEDYARRHNVPRYYDKAEDLINDSEVNAVYIATPPGSHAQYAIMAIEAGKPVYVEKPMALNYRECQMINEAAEKYNIPVFVAYYRRTLPGFLKVKELIENGAIGNVRFFIIQLFKAPSEDEKSGKLPWRVKPEISGGGHFFDLASHQIDYLDFLFGPVLKVKSVVLNQGGLYKAEDYVSVQFVFGNGVTGNGTWCFSLDHSSNRDLMEFFGDRGSIRLSCFTFEPIVVISSYGTREYINERPENVQYYLIEQVVNELLGKGKAVSTGISGARASKVMDEIVEEYYASNS